MSLQQEPSTDRSSNQDARSDCKHLALPRGFLSSAEFREVAIAGTAGTEVIEPPVRFIERHRSRRNSLQNVHAWTPVRPPSRSRKDFRARRSKRIRNSRWRTGSRGARQANRL